MFAAVNGRTAIVRTLIKRNADINQKSAVSLLSVCVISFEENVNFPFFA